MHETLLAIQQQLAVVISQLRSVIPNDEPIGVAQANWGFAALSRADLIDGVQALIDRIEYEGCLASLRQVSRKPLHSNHFPPLPG
ncbi:hypothetical protein [Bradyrhizobium sp. LA2.1]|uniref:hypothetical protein n=1 Tax=Bradyrhizobium sp. LA2.1 TaxID=3156376 RepID=UPI00339B5341